MAAVIHGLLGNMYGRFDLQMYAVQFERRSRAAISAALGLEGADAGNPDAIVAAIEALKGQKTPEDIDFSIKRGDVVTNGRWTISKLIVEDVNWALRAVALRLGNRGGLVVWPANGLLRLVKSNRWHCSAPCATAPMARSTATRSQMDRHVRHAPL